MVNRQIKFKTKLYEHQRNSVKFHLSRMKSGNWSEMGTGKSAITLAVLRILYNQGIINNILVVCPLSVLETWRTEIDKHTTFEYTRLVGTLENKIKLLHSETPIFLISYDSIPGRKQTLGVLFGAIASKKFDVIICDEATHLKSYKALRTKAVMQLCDSIPRTIFLSGQPIIGKPEEVLTIYRAMDGGATFGKNFWAARHRYFENHGYAFPDWHLKKDKAEEFKEKLFTNCTRVLKSECLQLPEKIFTERYAYLTPEQISVYVPIAQELLQILHLPAGEVKITNKLVKLAKLSQVSNGFIYTDKKPQVFAHSPKLDLLHTVIEEIPEDEKMVIFAKWRQDIETIGHYLDTNNIGYTVIHGSVKDRQSPIANFTNDADTRVLLSQITAGAYGLNLMAANHVIYYSVGFSAGEWMQSQDRIHRIGQTKTCIYISLLCDSTVDVYIADVLKSKTDLAKSLTDEVSVNRLKRNLELLCLN